MGCPWLAIRSRNKNYLIDAYFWMWCKATPVQIFGPQTVAVTRLTRFLSFMFFLTALEIIPYFLFLFIKVDVVCGN